MIKNKRVLIVIPARMGGYRFPGKPIRDICGKPMIQWCWEHASRCAYADRIMIATPNEEVREVAEAFGAEVMMTADVHRRGTERVHEAYRKTAEPWDIVVNFQGDEPLITPACLELSIRELDAHPDVACVNLYRWMSYHEAEADQNEVKVVIDNNSNALYFSRNPLPAIWLGDKQFECRIETGVMAMTAVALERFASLDNAYYEHIESVDMLRFVENGDKVRMVETKAPSKSVDCEADLETVIRIMADC
jgi:3-deoxy-manno-octulosonate cytidylyltransferase (CMP-KDO synthetase)